MKMKANQPLNPTPESSAALRGTLWWRRGLAVRYVQKPPAILAQYKDRKLWL